jgi:hypothetical protein
MVAIQTRGRRPIPAGLKAPNAQQREERRRRKMIAEQTAVKSVVLAQPHRAWYHNPEEPMLESALGRLCARYRLNKVLFDAALEFMVLSYRVLRGSGCPVPFTLGGGGGGTGEGPSKATRDRWERDLFGLESELRRVARQDRALVAVRHLVMENEDLPVHQEAIAINGLMALARAMDKDVGGHPFL